MGVFSLPLQRDLNVQFFKKLSQLLQAGASNVEFCDTSQNQVLYDIIFALEPDSLGADTRRLQDRDEDSVASSFFKDSENALVLM